MRANKGHVYGLIITLLLIGLSLFFYRHLILDVPLTDSESVNSWMVEANLRFTADKNMPVKASLTIPYMPPYLTILDEYFISQNYGVTTSLNGYNRRAIWTLRRGGGSQSLYYRAIFRETEHYEGNLPKRPQLKIQSLSQEQKSAADIIINQARQASADIQTFAQATVKELNKRDGNARLLADDFSDENMVNAAIVVLNQARIYAMPVQAVHLSQQHKANFQLFMAVYDEKEWVYINPRTGVMGLPKNFLIWQYGNDPKFQVVGGKKAQFTLTISSTPMNALSVAKVRGVQSASELLRFSLLQLPVDVQETYKILLMVPIGAFIILLLRNFIGLSTFGTFMPVLIALAFRETHVIWGIALFTIIVSFGLLARFYLDELRLLLVPRLAAILTIVILLMIFISVICQNLNLDSGLSVALFPMVILTMTIERMCITWDERGAYDAMKAGVGSLVAAVICFSVMNCSALQYVIFAFPELLLVLLAFILWFGQYRGYRLFELVRFNALSGAK